VKTTEHFEKRFRKRRLEREWCERVVAAPVEVERQENGYYRFWGYIEEEGKFLRVVTLEDRETFETAHWDRRYKRKP
jgi:hypothetical protein